MLINAGAVVFIIIIVIQAADEEDLGDNAFFRALQEKHAKFYGQITSACALICVPSAIGTAVSIVLDKCNIMLCVRFRLQPWLRQPV